MSLHTPVRDGPESQDIAIDLFLTISKISRYQAKTGGARGESLGLGVSLPQRLSMAPMGINRDKESRCLQALGASAHVATLRHSMDAVETAPETVRVALTTG